MADWTNRRKELKFAATDLKLSRRHQTTRIGHWSRWRASAAPKTFMLWGARLRPQDKIEKMIKETEVLLATYLDGAGIFASAREQSLRRLRGRRNTRWLHCRGDRRGSLANRG